MGLPMIYLKSRRLFLSSVFLLVAFHWFIAAENVLMSKPKPAPKRWMGLMGKYQYNEDHFLILEKATHLYLLTSSKTYLLLTEQAENVFSLPDESMFHHDKIRFVRNHCGLAEECIVGRQSYRRALFGTEEGKPFRIAPVKPVSELEPLAKKATPPRERGPFLTPELVEVTRLDPTIKLDIRYATSNNFMGAAFYSKARAYLQKPAAEALVRVHRTLNPLGYGVLIFDAYRPWHVTKMFWEATPKGKKEFVANPRKGSRHNRGAAVDVTLYDLKTGRPVKMGSAFDEFSERSHPGYPGGTSLERWNRRFLTEFMAKEGFKVFHNEWWHFDYKDWRKYPIMNVDFDRISDSE